MQRGCRAEPQLNDDNEHNLFEFDCGKSLFAARRCSFCYLKSRLRLLQSKFGALLGSLPYPGNRARRPFTVRPVRTRSALWSTLWPLRRVSIDTIPLQNQREAGRAALSSIMRDCRCRRAVGSISKNWPRSKAIVGKQMFHQAVPSPLTLPFSALSTSDRGDPACPSSDGADHRCCRLQPPAPESSRARERQPFPCAAARTA